MTVTQEELQASLPTHIGVIMDGNGRWAVNRGLSRKAGHKKGAEAFEKLVEHAGKLGIKHLTVYAFSTENFRRPQDEVDSIMDLMRDYLQDRRKRRNDKVRTIFIGDLQRLDQDIQNSVRELEEDSKNNTEMTLNIAFNYGGRLELTQAAKKIAQAYQSGKITSLDTITEETLSGYLYTAGQPEVDLVIRTSGELRLSNFLIWQAAYAELVFSPVLWPDFSAKELDKAIAEYAKRNRRIGGV